VDKISCLAFILYQSSKSDEVKKIAIQLLNGDVTLRELRKNFHLKPQLIKAESILKKNQFERNKVQDFVERFMLIEV
jgi:hypothetical protein